MIVDASAIVAIVHGEPEAPRLARAIHDAAVNRMAAPNFLEAAIVIDARRDPVASRAFEELIALTRIAVEPFTAEHARIAREAYRDFGKGSGHPAQLNFGDCFAYALAQATGEPLLYVGNDFVHTDVRPALAGGDEV